MEQAIGFSRDDAAILLKVIDEWKTRPVSSEGPVLPGPLFDRRPPVVVELLEPLESGQTARAVLLRLANTGDTQTITAYGSPSQGTWRIGFKPSTTSTEELSGTLSSTATAAEVRLALLACPSLRRDEVEVDGGNVTYDETNVSETGRWIVQFHGRYKGVDLPALRVASSLTGPHTFVVRGHVLEDSGQVLTVREVLGLPTPSPLREGCRVICNWFDELGYCAVSAEAREFGLYGFWF